VRLDGASYHYAPQAFPAVADYRMVARLVAAAEARGFGHHVGLVVSSDTFYPGQERRDSFTGYVPRSLHGTLEEWRSLGCLSYEMEAATLFTVTRSMGLASACVLGVIVNRCSSEHVDPADVRATEEKAILCACDVVKGLIASPRSTG